METIREPSRTTIGLDLETLHRLDAWRKQYTVIPARSEALRQLLDIALAKVAQDGER
jgi:hypothetical protein